MTARRPAPRAGRRARAAPARGDRPAPRALPTRRWSSATWKDAPTSRPPGTWDGRSARSRAGSPAPTAASAIACFAAAWPRTLGRLALPPGSKVPALPVPPALLDSTTTAAVRFAGMGPAVAVRGSAVSLAEGVLRTMSMTHWWKVATVLLVAGATASGVEWLGHGGAPATQNPAGKQDKDVRAGDAPTREVTPGKLKRIVSARGSVEAAQNWDRLLPDRGADGDHQDRAGRIACQEGGYHRRAGFRRPARSARQSADHDPGRRGQLPERQADPRGRRARPQGIHRWHPQAGGRGPQASDRGGPGGDPQVRGAAGAEPQGPASGSRMP